MKTIDYYHINADKLAAQYDSLSFAQVHSNWLHILSELPAKASIVDIGAGSGRDARALQQLGFTVTAVEPADKLRKLGQHHASEVIWLDDTLPDLRRLKLNQRFDLVLVSAVWMHLNQAQQKLALKNIKQLLTAKGIAVITLRHGSFDDGRTAHQLDANWLIHQAELNNLKLRLNTTNTDQLERQHVHWQTLVFQHIT